VDFLDLAIRDLPFDRDFPVSDPTRFATRPTVFRTDRLPDNAPAAPPISAPAAAVTGPKRAPVAAPAAVPPTVAKPVRRADSDCLDFLMVLLRERASLASEYAIRAPDGLAVLFFPDSGSHVMSSAGTILATEANMQSYHLLEGAMRKVTIRRCPVCQSIGSHTEHLVDELRKDSDLQVNIVNGEKGEFIVEVDGRPIKSRSGEWLRDVSELSAEVRGLSPATP